MELRLGMSSEFKKKLEKVLIDSRMEFLGCELNIEYKMQNFVELVSKSSAKIIAFQHHLVK